MAPAAGVAGVDMASAGPAGAGDQPRFRYHARLANEIELRWQDHWEAAGTFRTPNPAGPLAAGFDQAAGRPKFMIMDMFPYPSGSGLHVGHPLGYVGADVAERMTHVQAGAARVREHVHDHELRAAGRLVEPRRQRPGRVRRAERPGRLPMVLPAQFDLVREPRVVTEPRLITRSGRPGASHIHPRRARGGRLGLSVTPASQPAWRLPPRPLVACGQSRSPAGSRAPRAVMTATPAANTSPAQIAAPRSRDGRPGQSQGVVSAGWCHCVYRAYAPGGRKATGPIHASPLLITAAHSNPMPVIPATLRSTSRVP